MFEKLDFKPSQIHLTSDLHGWHRNIAKGTSVWGSGYRDFDNQYEMTDEILKNINKYVKEDDLLIEAGDHSFGGEENVEILRKKIKCKNIYFLQGNHDQHIPLSLTNVFTKIAQVGYYKVDDIKFIVGHFPFCDWYKKREGTYMFHGHCHSQESRVLKTLHTYDRIIDVGIDNAFKLFGVYRPFNLLELIKLLEDKQLE